MAGKPHRGVLVLVMGILAIVFNVCFIPGVLAIIFGNQDLREMDAGAMDPTGRGMTQAGRICGIIGTVLTAAWALFYLLFIVLAIGGRH
jgi:hypothetical protein